MNIEELNSRGPIKWGNILIAVIAILAIVFLFTVPRLACNTIENSSTYQNYKLRDSIETLNERLSNKVENDFNDSIRNLVIKKSDEVIESTSNIRYLYTDDIQVYNGKIKLDGVIYNYDNTRLPQESKYLFKITGNRAGVIFGTPQVYRFYDYEIRNNTIITELKDSYYTDNKVFKLAEGYQKSFSFTHGNVTHINGIVIEIGSNGNSVVEVIVLIIFLLSLIIVFSSDFDGIAFLLLFSVTLYPILGIILILALPSI